MQCESNLQSFENQIASNTHWQIAGMKPLSCKDLWNAAGLAVIHSASHSRISFFPANDGAEVVNGVADRVRSELLRNMDLGDLLHPSVYPTKGASPKISSPD